MHRRFLRATVLALLAGGLLDSGLCELGCAPGPGVGEHSGHAARPVAHAAASPSCHSTGHAPPSTANSGLADAGAERLCGCGAAVPAALKARAENPRDTGGFAWLVGAVAHAPSASFAAPQRLAPIRAVPLPPRLQRNLPLLS